MESKGFSIGDALKVGWREMKKHWLFFSGFVLVMIAVAIFFVVGVIAAYMHLHPHVSTTHGVGAVVAALVLFVLESIMALGLIKSALHVVRGESLHFGDLFGEAKKVVAYIVAHILYLLILIAPYVLLVAIPAAIFAELDVNIGFIGMWSAYAMGLSYILALMLLAKYIFYPFAIVDKGVGPIDALKFSHKITDGCKWDVLFLYFAVALVAYLGLLFFGIGILYAIPLGIIAMAAVYHRLTVQ